METLSKQTHPLILVAAASLSIASLAAAAHYTGLIPARVATPDEAPIALAASTAAPSPAPIPAAGAVATLPAAPTDSAKASAAQHGAAPRPATRTRAEHRVPVAHEATREERSDDWGGSTRRVAHDDAGIDVIPARPSPVTQQPSAPLPPACADCGTVQAVRDVETRGEGSGLGAIAGGVIGGLLGNQIGGGRGRNLATIAGAVGGAYAGHQVEKNVRSEKQQQVTVRFDDGRVQSYTQSGPWQNGERVRLNDGAIAKL